MLKNNKLRARWQSAAIEVALSIRRVLILAGPRQCGKTTLAKMHVNDDVIYHNLDNLLSYEAAKNDPHSFIEHGDNLMIIDEIQKVPKLLQAIKSNVDENNKYGRFLLTGSSNIRAMPNVNESLAGRVRIIRLRPLAMGEIFDNLPNFLDLAFEEKFQIHEESKNFNKKNYLSIAFKGGYPEIQNFNSQKDIKQWHQDYLNALMENDLNDITNIKRKDSIHKILECLASWSSKIMNLSEIGSSLSIVQQTVENQINALETLYLVEKLKPWIKTDYDRVGKKDKIFITDSGLMTSILKWHYDKVFLDGEKNGKLIETFIFNQLSAIIDASQQDYEIYHYRDRQKREIDFIIENEDGDYLGIEVKSGTNINAASFKHLKWFRDNMVKDSNFIGIILYSGQHILRFGEKMWVVPINALWS